MKNKNAEAHDSNSFIVSTSSGLRQHTKNEKLDNILSFEHKISESNLQGAAAHQHHQTSSEQTYPHLMSDTRKKDPIEASVLVFVNHVANELKSGGPRTSTGMIPHDLTMNM